MIETHISDVARVIQLAIAPVFLLSGVGTIILVLSNRLARIVDRTRALEHVVGEAQEQAAHTQNELSVLAHRMGLVYLAIGLSVVCALMIGLLIVLAFVDAFLSINLSTVVGLMFMGSMLSLVASLLAFLREIFLAVKTAREAVHIRLPLQRVLVKRSEMAGGKQGSGPDATG